MVVWDLDGTLWKGTLDHGDEVVPTGLHHWIEPLAKAGVMSSVCSNNDPAKARAALAALGVWDWIVFPNISWNPKSSMLGQLLEDIQLRPEDVLYIDDLERLRTLAADEFGMKSANPLDVEPFPGWIHAPRQSDRLAHYRTLEKRARARSTSPHLDSDGFLKQSGVRVAITPVRGHTARIASLSQRSNQLNYTESRLTEDDVAELGIASEMESGALWVRDKYGDYGLSGFYARPTDGPLIHLFFSCRILHLGVEGFVYRHLGRPPIVSRSTRVVGNRWRDLTADVNWIELEQRDAPDIRRRDVTLWAGGCDLQILSGYLGNETDSDLWILPGNLHGAQVYARSSLLTLLARPEDQPALEKIPWTAGFSDAVLSPDWRTMVLSPWVDCASWTYTHQRTGVRIPSFVALDSESTDSDWDHWWGDNTGRQEFLSEYTLGPPLPPEEVEELLLHLATRLAGRLLMVLTVPEIDNGHEYPWGERQISRHSAFNQALESASRKASNIALLDVREHVWELAHLHDHEDPVMFHYTRDRYLKLSEAIVRTFSSRQGPRTTPSRRPEAG